MPSSTGYDVIIVGAGFAGCSTAAELARNGRLRVAVVEAEAIAGHHASGRNAAMARRVIEDPSLTRLAYQSVRLIRGRWPGLVGHRGGLLLGDEAHIAQLHAAARAEPALVSSLEKMSLAEAARRWPMLDGASAKAALWSPDCGVVDIHGLLSAYIRDARQGGVEFLFGHGVRHVDHSAGSVSGVVLSDGTRLHCNRLVNAAGFAINRIAAMAGAAPIDAAPFRRHLFVTAKVSGEVRTDAPFVWDVSNGYYFRPEGEGLLLCACDQSLWPEHFPDEPHTDPEVRELLAERFSQHVPQLRHVRPKQQWAGLRVLTPDHRFAIGEDPQRHGLYWVAALGGHGVTTSAAVGRFAANELLGLPSDPELRQSLSVSRLQPAPQPSPAASHSSV